MRAHGAAFPEGVLRGILWLGLREKEAIGFRGVWGARVEAKLFALKCPPIGTANQPRQRAFSQKQMGGNQAQAGFLTHAPPKLPGPQLRQIRQKLVTKSPEKSSRGKVARG